MRNIKLILQYDGTNYCGWQRQKNAKTVQQTLEDAIYSIVKEDIKVIGCSRTDSGVHAKQYVANFFTNTNIPDDKLKFAINTKLPEDIVVLNSEEVSLDFHSRYNCKGKTYVYTVLNRDVPEALYRDYMYHFPRKLNVENMAKATKYIIGKHDFKAFKSQGSSVKTSIRTITDFHITKDNEIIKFSITGDGFLYNMVRIIVGTFLDVGVGKIRPEYIKYILEMKDRLNAGKVVPAKGLCLEKVFY